MDANYRILLIEDNDEDAELIKIELAKNSLPLQVDHISDLGSLEPYFEKGSLDLVISDYNLPNATGIENIQRVKDYDPDLPFILISGFINEEVAIESMVAGASDYVMKDNLQRLNPAVTRELQAYKERRQNKRLLEEAYQLAKIGHWELDLTKDELFWSKEVKRLHEVDQDYVPTLETALNFYEEGEHRDSVRTFIDQAIAQGISYQFEAKIITAKGSERWVRVSGEVLKEKDKVLKLFGSIQNITDEKKATARLKETERDLRNIVEQSTNLFYRHDVNHNLTYLSPQSYYYLGCSPREAKKKWTEFVTDHKVNKKGFESTERALKTGEKQPPFELQLKRQDGQLLWVFVNEVPIYENGEVVGISGSLTDITSLKEVQEQHHLLSMVASETQNLVLITDKEQKIEWVNDAFINKTGYSREEVMGKNPGQLLQGPNTQAEKVANIRNNLTENNSFSETLLNYTKSGEPYWVRLNITPILDDDGHVIKYFSIQEDITDQIKNSDLQKLQKEQLEESQRVGKLGHWSYYPKTGEIQWSDNMYRIYEMDPEDTPANLNEVYAMYPEEGDFHKTMVDRAINDGLSYSFDIKLKTGKGNLKFVHIEGLTEKDEETGEISRLHGVVMDITERKEAELELQERESEIQRITSNIGGLFLKYVLYPDGTDDITYISDGVRSIHEIEPKDALADPGIIWDLTVQEDLTALQESIQESAKNMQPWDHKWRIRTPSGKVKWIHGRGIPNKELDGSIQWDSLLVDVTQSVMTEQEKKDLQNIIENNTSEIYIMEMESLQLIYINHVAAEHRGFESNIIEPEDQPAYEIPDLIKPKIEYLKAGSRQNITFETLHHRVDGSTYNAQVQLTKSTYKGQEVLIAFALDITHQKKVSSRFRSLLNTAPIAIYMLDHQGRISDFWNNAAEQIIGYRQEEVIGDHFPNLSDDKLLPYQKVIEEAKQGHAVRGKEILKRRKDGSYFPARVNAVALKQNGDEKETILVTVEDITEEKELEQNLKGQLSFNSTILDSLPGLFYMVNENLEVIRVNQQFLDFFKLKEENLAELNPLNLIHPDDQPLLLEKLREVKEHGFAEAQIRAVVDGKAYYFSINGKSLRLNGQTFIIGNGIDVDSRIRTEMHNEVLLQEVHHRVKNNLAIISGLLWLEMSDIDEDSARLPLQRSINRIHSMAKVHELLYDTSNLSTINIDKYLQELSAIIKNTFSAGDEIKFSTKAEELEMSVNEAVPLGMLFNELMSNSIKYAFNGSPGEIKIHISKKDHLYEVLYADNGQGFKDDFKLKKPKTLGMNIIRTLLVQLKADYTLETNNKFELRFSFVPKIKGSHSNI